MSVIITGRGGENHATKKRNLLMKFEKKKVEDLAKIYNSRNLLMKFEFSDGLCGVDLQQ